MVTFRKSSWKNDLNHETLNFSIRQIKSNTGFDTPHTTELLIDELRKTETTKYELQGEQRLLTVVAACGQRKMLRAP
jgi:hypothetical protein